MNVLTAFTGLETFFFLKESNKDMIWTLGFRCVSAPVLITKFHSFIKSILKSLVILAIWLALSGAIYSRIALFFALNRIFFSARFQGSFKVVNYFRKMKGKKSLCGEFCNCYYQNFCCFSPKIVRFQDGSNKVAIELSGVQFWSEIILVTSNHAYDFRPNCTPLSSITIMNCTCSTARSFASGCRNDVFQNSHHQNQAQEENFYRRFQRVICVLRNWENYNLLQFVMDSFEETLFWTVFSPYSTKNSPTWRYFTCSYISSPSSYYSQRP